MGVDTAAEHIQVLRGWTSPVSQLHAALMFSERVATQLRHLWRRRLFHLWMAVIASSWILISCEDIVMKTTTASLQSLVSIATTAASLKWKTQPSFVSLINQTSCYCFIAVFFSFSHTSLSVTLSLPLSLHPCYSLSPSHSQLAKFTGWLTACVQLHFHLVEWHCWLCTECNTMHSFPCEQNFKWTKLPTMQIFCFAFLLIDLNLNNFVVFHGSSGLELLLKYLPVDVHVIIKINVCLRQHLGLCCSPSWLITYKIKWLISQHGSLHY